MIDQIFAYFVVTVFCATAMLFALSGVIIDWLDAREKRKKAAAAAKSAADVAADPAAGPA